MGYFNPLPKNTENCLIDGPAPKGDLKFINEIFTVINRSIRTAAKKAGVSDHNPSRGTDLRADQLRRPVCRMISHYRPAGVLGPVPSHVDGSLQCGRACGGTVQPGVGGPRARHDHCSADLEGSLPSGELAAEGE
ncbi:MAG: hypothetical protein U1U88_001376 [Lawsonella clevelandensis]